MSYLHDITTPLTKTLRHFATFPAHQLAGHAANLDFWRSEVEHRREVIRSYEERFQRMREAEQAYGKAHGYGQTEIEEFGERVVVPVDPLPPTRRSTSDSDRQRLLRELDEAFDAFLRRIQKGQPAGEPDAEPASGANALPGEQR